MKFKISRISHRGGNKSETVPPVAEAVWNEVGGVAKNGEPYIAKYWTIDIDSLEALLRLAMVEGELIVAHEVELLPSIDIYDDYNE